VKIPFANQLTFYSPLLPIPQLSNFHKALEYFVNHYTKNYISRHAKKKLDDWSFFGGVLHVTYAPEYESVEETREKLQDRRKAVAARLRILGKVSMYM
jgi:hypothetical protein